MSNGTKNAQCPGSGTVVTSLINDTNFDQWMVQWLKMVTSSKTESQMKKSLILGFSSSGTSRDIVKALQWGYSNDMKLACITAKPLIETVPKTSEVVMGVDYYHTADIDDMYMHHFTNANSPYNDGWTQEYHQKELEKMDYEPKRNHQYKYHEEEILKDIEEYVSKTYQGHYTGTKHEFRKVQTIDLMAARDIAAQFCQANILKYGSRYGSKDGRNKTDLLKVVHYAMLLLHFDGHYGEPSMPSGNFDQMP